MEIDQISQTTKLRWSIREDLNLQPIAYKAIALPIELPMHLVRTIGLEPMTYGM